MKHLPILFILLLTAPANLAAQSADTSGVAPFEVTVTNFDNEPQPGERIVFEGLSSGTVYEGVTNSNGQFTTYLEGGETYKLKVESFGETAEYSTFPVEELGEGMAYGVSQLTIQFELPRTFTLDNVHFSTGKSTLRQESYAELNELLEYMKLKPSLVIEIAGHTDNVGSDASNQVLSEERAARVRNYLISNGIAPDRVKANGYGENQPVAPNTSPEGRQKNRRTEVRILER